MVRSGTPELSSSQALPEDEAKEVVNQRVVKGTFRRRASPGRSPKVSSKLSPSRSRRASPKLSFRPPQKHSKSSRGHSSSPSPHISRRSTPHGSPVASPKSSRVVAPGRSTGGSPSPSSSASRKKRPKRSPSVSPNGSPRNSRKLPSKTSPKSSTNSSPSHSRSPTPKQSRTGELISIPEISLNSTPKEHPVAEKTIEVTNTFTIAQTSYDVELSESESDSSLLNAFAHLPSRASALNDSSPDGTPELSPNVSCQETPVTSPIRSLSNSPDRSPDSSPNRAFKEPAGGSPEGVKRVAKSPTSAREASREDLSPERRAPEAACVDAMAAPTDKPAEEPSDNPTPEPAPEKAVRDTEKATTQTEGERGAPLTQSAIPVYEDAFIQKIYPIIQQGGAQNFYVVQNVMQEERRRNGQYTAVCLVLVAALTGLYHACRAQNAVLAGFLVPALIMLLYLLWVLYSAQRARAKQVQLMRALGVLADGSDAATAAELSAAGECKIIMMPDEAGRHRQHKSSAKSGKRVASPKRTRSPAKQEIPKVVIKGPTPVRELGPDMVV